MSSYTDSAAYPVIPSTEGVSTGKNAGSTFTNGEVWSFRISRKASFTDNVTDTPNNLSSSHHHNNSS